MAGSVNIGYCMWLDGSTVSSQIARVSDVASSFTSGGTVTSMAVQSGVLGSVGGLQVVPNSGMNVVVYAGFAIIANSTSNLQGAYKAGSMVSNTITVAASDPTNPRIDLIVINVNDIGTSGSDAFIQTITGTPAVSPIAPTAPANSLILAQISVPANTTTISSGLITDKRTFAAAAGGIVPYLGVSSSVGGYPGCVAYDATNDRFFHNNGPSTDEQFKVLPWVPKTVFFSSNTAPTTGTTVNLLSTNFTTDGQTDIKITVKWPGLFTTSGTTGNWQFGFSMTIDSTQLDAQYVVLPANLGSTISSGGMFTYCTSSGTSDTPTSGTHNMIWQVFITNVGGTANGTPSIRATAAQLAYLRVEPVIL